MLSFNRDKDSFTSSYFSPWGAFCLSHPGFFTFGSLPVWGPTPPPLETPPFSDPDTPAAVLVTTNPEPEDDNDEDIDDSRCRLAPSILPLLPLVEGGDDNDDGEFEGSDLILQQILAGKVLLL